MNKIILLSFGLMVFAMGYSQQKGEFRVGLDLGYAMPLNGAEGPLLSIEPKYNIKNNMNIGLRLGFAGIAGDVKSNGNTIASKLSLNSSYVATYDYYFNRSGKSFVPYVGVGAGYYSIGDIKLENTSISNTEIGTQDKIGGLVRGGFEWARFRFGVEYNIIPKSDLKDVNGASNGTLLNSYFGINAGFYLGGGKWGNKK